MAGYSGTPLAKKLGIREGHRIGWHGAPAGFAESVDSGSSATVDHGFAHERSYDVIVVFVRELAGLTGVLDRFRPLLRWNGGLWLAWPKPRGGLASDISGNDVRRAGLEGGLVDNKVCAIDENWSGLRFVYRTKDRPV